MGFFEELFSNLDEPAFYFRWEDKPNDIEINQLREENRKLRSMIKKLLEEGIVEERQIKRVIDIESNNLLK